MQNKVPDLINHLFDQLERFEDPEVCKDKETLEQEIRKASAISSLSQQILEANRLQLDGVKFAAEYNIGGKELPETLGVNNLKAIEDKDVQKR